MASKKYILTFSICESELTFVVYRWKESTASYLTWPECIDTKRLK